jgi:dTDP-4-amino-4,6-dideoxygalactose transaminase
MDMNRLPFPPFSRTVALQLIHLGGIPADIQKALEYAKKNNLFLIEDCAQAFGSLHKNKNIGSFGDVACFSLIKSAYGIGGGILATNNKSIFDRALIIQNRFKKSSSLLSAYRCIRAVLETYRKFKGIDFILNIMIPMAQRKAVSKSVRDDVFVKMDLNRPTSMYFKVFHVQSKKFSLLHSQRIMKARLILDSLSENNITNLPIYGQDGRFVFSKLYLHDPKIKAHQIITRLRGVGIECMHLEHKHRLYIQPRIDQLPIYSNGTGIKACKNYLEIHDRIISLPLFEKMGQIDISKIVNQVSYHLTENNIQSLH